MERITDVIDMFLDDVTNYLIRPVSVSAIYSSREFRISTRNIDIAIIFIREITDEIIIEIRYQDCPWPLLPSRYDRENRPVAEFEISDPNFTPQKVAEIINKNLILVASKHNLPIYEFNSNGNRIRKIRMKYETAWIHAEILWAICS